MLFITYSIEGYCMTSFKGLLSFCSLGPFRNWFIVYLKEVNVFLTV